LRPQPPLAIVGRGCPNDGPIAGQPTPLANTCAFSRPPGATVKMCDAVKKSTPCDYRSA
jgi:hypothetical protein